MAGRLGSRSHTGGYTVSCETRRKNVRYRAHHRNEQEDTTGGTTTPDSLPSTTSMVVLSALAPKDRAFDGALPLPPVEHDLRRALAKQKGSKRSCFGRRERWRCSTRSSVPLGDAVAPEHTKRNVSPSRGTEIGLQTYRSSRRVHSVRGFESPTISMGSASELELARYIDGEPFLFYFYFFQAYRD